MTTVVRASVRSLCLLTDSRDLTEYVSADPWNDAVGLRMLVVPANSIGEESFDLRVCTPGWLATETMERGPQIGRHLLIVEVINAKEVSEFLRRRVEDLIAPSWGELAEKIGRLGYWEFEDYESHDEGPRVSQ